MRCAAPTELAVAHPASLTAETIASRQGLPLAFTKQILSAMRRAGLVQSQRGGDGGYRLLPPPDGVSVADIVRAVEGPLADVRGEAPETLTTPRPPPRCARCGSPRAPACGPCSRT